ncbi:DUF413 domain-containing protein [uncultured Paraglaciecola sp.]|uniref:DUF413 domain-containing protein n=1 Tax=uncultured Paraglaciecola sp. TaxID=1765024 RepID=UPI00259935EE|nr:DUF413 domain-containing protein [uncultured Paraglaciecola sp.]
MDTFNVRPGSKTYLDPLNFKYGFRKSGDFSITESEILSTYGHTLLALEMGEVTPETDAEIHFVQAVTGKLEADSKLEKTWIKYVRLSRTKRTFFTLYSSASKSKLLDNDAEEYDSNDLEAEV